MNLKIDPNGLPVEGLHLEGQLPPTVFELGENDSPKPVSPLTLSLDVNRDDDDILVTGSVSATFEMVCGRCTEPFQQRIDLAPYDLAVPIENGSPIDLTTWLREDILLTLPPHPRCENGNVTPRACPAEGRFDPASDADGEESGDADGSRAWDALDKLSNLKSN